MPALAPRRVALGARRPAAPTARPARGAPLLCRADSVLIANTKGGGHAFLGLHLARKLVKDGHSVTILNDGEEVRRGEERVEGEVGCLCVRGRGRAACGQKRMRVGEKKKDGGRARARAVSTTPATPGPHPRRPCIGAQAGDLWVKSVPGWVGGRFKVSAWAPQGAGVDERRESSALAFGPRPRPPPPPLSSPPFPRSHSSSPPLSPTHTPSLNSPGQAAGQSPLLRVRRPGGRRRDRRLGQPGRPGGHPGRPL